MKSPHSLLFLIGLLAAPLAPVAHADSIPYSRTGTVAPEVPVFASSNGITAYYYGSTAALADFVGVYDLQTGYDSGAVLSNKTTAVGTSIKLGTGAGQIRTGDQLAFYISGAFGTFYSLTARNTDGINHAYITSFSGGTVNNVAIPAGLFVGLEDLPKSYSDLNYNDDTFVFTGVTAPSIAVTPEPTSLLLVATGLLGVGQLVRRRRVSE